MKLRTSLYLLIILHSTFCILHSFELYYHHSLSGQRRDGTKLFDITYELTDLGATDSVNIFVWAITQSGETLAYHTPSGVSGTFSGAIGNVHGPGVKHILWNIGIDAPNREFYSDSIMIYLSAGMGGWAPGVCGGEIYVADDNNDRIVRIDDMDGTNWIDYGSHGLGDGEFDRPIGIAVAPDGRIYILDRDNHRIVRIDDMDGTGWIEYGSLGSGVGEFYYPIGIAVGPDERIYIADYLNDRIVRIDDMFGTNWIDYGVEGSGDDEFDGPVGIAVGLDGRIYIADYRNDRIVRIDDMDGTNWTEYGTEGSGIGEFDNPFGIFVAP